jgi:putative effector of murein hydrolase LrgA (UPF0299 family)
MELAFRTDMLSIVGSFTLSAIIAMLSALWLKDLIISFFKRNHEGSDKV